MSTSDDNKQRVLNLHRSFATRDKDRIASYFTEDAEWIAPEHNAMVVALDVPAGWFGRDAVVGYLTGNVGSLFRDAKVELLSVTADGNHVVVEQKFEATVINGRPYSMIYCFVFEFRNHLIRQVRPYFDTVSGFEQIFGEETPRKLV